MLPYRKFFFTANFGLRFKSYSALCKAYVFIKLKSSFLDYAGLRVKHTYSTYFLNQVHAHSQACAWFTEMLSKKCVFVRVCVLVSMHVR